MTRRRSTRPLAHGALAITIATLFFGGCALVRRPAVPRAPGFMQPDRLGQAACETSIARAHAALAAAGAAAGNPSAVAAAHADHAAAMSEYHACLADRSRP